jgi:tripartite-type tricarboxylate transporter receptor subunit TctC
MSTGNILSLSRWLSVVVRWDVLAWGVAAWAVSAVTLNPAAAAYPERAVRLIVGFSAGGGTDFLARLIAAKLSEKWGQPVVVENREGADGTIAEEWVARAAPDGYTIGMVINTHTVTPLLRKLTYDPIKSFESVTLLESHPDVLVINPAVLQVNSLRELIALAKAKPGELNFGSGGASTPPFLITQLLMSRTGMKMVNVTYKGTAPMIVAMLGGEIQVMFGSVETTSQQVKAGKLKALAVSSKARSVMLPDVPTVAEAAALPGFDEGTWEGIVVPAHTPQEIVDRLHADIVAVLKTPDVKERFASQGYAVIGSTPGEFTKFIADDIAKWSALLKTLDLK